MTEGTFVSMDFNLPIRDKPVSHAFSEVPICEQCGQEEPPFFNMDCAYCKHILNSPSTTVSQIFAIMRQWAPSTQRKIGLLVEEAIRRGANVNDRDSLTDMTMLHYCAKAGAAKIGNLEGVIAAIRTLLHSGVNVEARCNWVDMTAIHFAALFNAPDVILILVREGNANPQVLSHEHDDGNALHIAARALALDAIRVLLRLDCDPHLENSKSLKPVECMPEKYGHIQCEQYKILEVVDKIHQEFEAFESLNVTQARSRRQAEDPQTQKDTTKKDRHLIRRESGSFSNLESLGLKIGDRVCVNRKRNGILRFFGKTDFQSGLWAGVELDEDSGRNDGSVGNYRYFSCRPNFGIFCVPSKLDPIASPELQHTSSSMDNRERSESGLADLPSLRPSSSSATSGTNISNSVSSPYLELGANVTLAGGKKGVIRFIGDVKFQTGQWVGVEYNEAIGKNDGSVDGIRYFRCKPNYGVFVTPSKIFRDDIPQGNNRTTRVNTYDSATTARRKKLSTLRSLNLNTSTSAPKTPDLVLAEGMSVFYPVQRETGIIKYMGPTELGEGLWLGVEFSKPIGKPDSKVNLRDYFKCRPNFSLLLRPSKLTYRGINCMKILPSLS
ncbi:CAP-Gly domain-containing linker protein 4-like [Oopsacas minuta]|uniref:CAP-Gly domain-containing linker protein 4-like n=1 Tax=Oopsacas minuta TaxID=111878 RepID=A0AAV7JWH3_9METZ|nr:CAP-Gly domain-containing linker protein 4-like [Oopsacas minuta]